MKKIGYLLGSIILSTQFIQAQDDVVQDSTQMVDLESVVITGQYSAQSVDKSLYQVEVISSEDIKNQAGNTIADVLNQNLNMQIIPSSGSGDSSVQMLGLDGGYVKVLVDNIPLVSDSGFGNNIDLTKINLDNVERIEIVKGTMGVDYGNNALAGIINIITKKNIKTDWRINFMVQEETVGKEYDWYENAGISKGKGRHIQALDINRKIGQNWFVSAGVNRNDFQGFWGVKKGRKYFGQDGRRGYEWLPKEQWNSYGSVNYRSKKFSAFYKISYLSEEINRYDSIVNLRILPGGERRFYATDRDYSTTRWVHHLNLQAKLLGHIQYDGDFSYQIQERKFQDYEYDIPARTELFRKDESTYLSTKSYYSRGTFSNFLNNEKIDFQIGYEFDFNKGFANAFAESFEFRENLDKEIGNYAGFASAEFRTGSGFSLRPGFRANFSNKFETQYNYSLSTKYNFTDHSNIRAVVGTANRFPNFMELYSSQIDINHQILGDENLVPESGYSTSIQWNNRNRFGELRMENNINTLYLNVNDKIELVNTDPSGADYIFMNINKFRTWGVSTDHRFWWNNLNFNIGASLFGESKSLLSESYGIDDVIEDDFLYSFQANSSANYTIPNWATVFSVYYKYTGKTTQYVKDFDTSNPQHTIYRLAERDPFSMLDASIRKGFYNNRFEVTLGARNILDVTSINDTSIIGQGHTGTGGGNFLMFYGRSYFLKLNYNLEF